MKAFIYCIRLGDTGRCYVGHTARSLERRFKEHLARLEKDRHHSPALQNAWNKYGPDAFEFALIEECHVDDRLSREQFYIDNLPSEFNVLPVAGTHLGRRRLTATKQQLSRSMRGNKNGVHVKSKAAKARISAAKRGKKQPWAAANGREGARKNSASQKGRIPTHWVGQKHRPETIAKMRAAALVREAAKRSSPAPLLLLHHDDHHHRTG